jgi:hypothetical protein
LWTTTKNWSSEIWQAARIITSASEREMMIGSAEKECAEGGILEQVKRNKILKGLQYSYNCSAQIALN